jgi:hypothetical protein
MYRTKSAMPHTLSKAKNAKPVLFNYLNKSVLLLQPRTIRLSHVTPDAVPMASPVAEDTAPAMTRQRFCRSKENQEKSKRND